MPTESSFLPSPRLHLDRSRTPRAFDPPESLWKKELGRMFELVRRHVDALRAMEGEPLERQPRLSIAIFGTYGSGKTSLLKTFARLANGGNLAEELGSEYNELDRLVYALPEIQPSLRSDDHFLYSFLAAALEEDLEPKGPKRRRPGRSEGGGQGADAWRRDQQPEGIQFLTPVQRSFQEVSEYLQVIDQAETPEEHDPLGFSLERLERHTSGLRLQRKLAQLIEQLGYQLAGTDHHSVLLLPVDDADMAQDKLVETLETFRRYLMHPRLVPVFSFTDRLAEELLRVHYAERLSLEESQAISEHLAESSSVSEMTQNLAFQYLVKLFPIRNRIRLGPAAARVQAATLTGADAARKSDAGQADVREEEVLSLLQAASVLLFGASEWPVVSEVRAALRPSTLRRQLQVVDAMYDCGLLEVVQEHRDALRTLALEKLKPRKEDHNPSVSVWAGIFDRATWSVLNAHRDALRAYDLHIEELQSWSSLGLRRTLTGTLLRRPQAERVQLLKSWRYRSEDRRAQVLSLLAANAFRPRMHGEEPTGDDPREWPHYLSSELNGEDKERDRKGLDVRLATVWFLELWIGFYLPQILARNQRTLDRRRDPDGATARSEPMAGVGWSLAAGPSHAVREFLKLRCSSEAGIMKVDPEALANLLKGRQAVKEDQAELNLLMHLWCFYGYYGRDPWAVISLWRIFGLLGQLLQEKLFCDREAGNFQERGKRILINAYRAAREPGVREGSTFSFERWDPEEEGPDGALMGCIDELVEDIEKWLDPDKDKKNKKEARILLTPPGWGARSERKDLLQDVGEWSGCLVRRLHGEQLLGELWRDLGTAYLEPPEEEPAERAWTQQFSGEPSARQGEDRRKDQEAGRWTAYTAIKKWSETLDRYFRDVRLVWKEEGDSPGPSSDAEGGEGPDRLGDFLAHCPLFSRTLEVLERTPRELTEAPPDGGGEDDTGEGGAAGGGREEGGQEEP